MVATALRPVILAAGKKTRFNGGIDGKTIKPLTEISGHGVGGPVTCQALYHLARMAFEPHEITIVVNENKSRLSVE